MDLGDLAIARYAHDLRNQLTVMVGCVECMYPHMPKDKVEREFREFLQAGERASMLTRELLLAVRPPASRRTGLDLNQVIGASCETITRLVGARIRVRVRESQKPAIVVAEATDIERILVSLALNARDAMPDGGVLTIETAVIDKPAHDDYEVIGPHVRMIVSDSGRGMTPEVQARMSSVAFTVRQLEGTLSIESQPKGGTSVVVDLPCAQPRPRSGSTIF